MKVFLNGVSFTFSFCSASLFCLSFSLFLSLNRMVSVSMVSCLKFGKVFPFSSGILGKRRRAKPCARAAKSRSVQGIHHFNQENYLDFASYDTQSHSPLMRNIKLHSCLAYACTHDTKAFMPFSNIALSCKAIAFSLGRTSTTSFTGGYNWRGHYGKKNTELLSTNTILQA